MGRIPRIEYKDAIYYIRARALTDLVATEDLARSFLEQLDRTGERFNILLYAYSLLPQEYHLVMKTPEANLVRAFQWFSTSYSRRHNNLLQQKGSVFKERYKAILLENDEWIEPLVHWVHHQPSSQSMETHAGDYPWSSLCLYLGEPGCRGGLEPSFYSQPMKGALYAKAFQSFQDSGENPLEHLKKGVFLGSESWVKAMTGKAQNGAAQETPPGEEREGLGAEGIEQAIEQFCLHIGIARDTLLSRARRRSLTKDMRDALIFHLFEQGIYSSRELALSFGVSGSAISHTVSSFRRRMEGGEDLQKVVDTVQSALSHDSATPKERTPEEVMASMERRISNVSFVNDDRGINRSPGQEDKTQRMRRQLILSTLFCLHQYGYHGASLSRILEHAGVSRGAWRHHFDSKIDLVATAARAMYEGTWQLARERAPHIAQSPDPLMAMFDFIWEAFHQGWHRNVWLEFTVAARTNPDLRRLVAPVTKGVMQFVAQLVADHMESSDPVALPPAALMNLTLHLSRGMAIQSVTAGDEVSYDALRRVWGELLRPHFHMHMGWDTD